MKVDNFPNGTPLVFHIFLYLCLSNVLGPLDETPHLSSCPNPPGSELCLSLQSVSAGGYELSGQSFSLWKTLENHGKPSCFPPIVGGSFKIHLQAKRSP